MKLVLLRAGEFTIGSTPTEQGHYEDEGPTRRVRLLKPFYLGVDEVTQGEFASVMGRNPSWYSGAPARFSSTKRHPVEQVSWYDAAEFCNRLSQREGLRPCYELSNIRRENVSIVNAVVKFVATEGYRLSSEAEWEYACRAGATTQYCFGNDAANLARYAWFRSNTWNVNRKHSQPVGTRKANRWGLHDMHGNVWEWCHDWFDANFYKHLPAIVADPVATKPMGTRSLRGGSWSSFSRDLRCANRYEAPPSVRGNNRGFRVARYQEDSR